jgi:hypothetical protein
MNRRAAIKNFVVFSAGAALIPSCMQEKTKASVKLKNIPLTGEQEKMLAALTETILPKTTTPGATDLASHLFVLKMADDCFEKEEREKFVKGMGQFEAYVRKQYKADFSECTVAQRTELLNEMERQQKNTPADIILSHIKDFPEEAIPFYETVKRLTIQSFVTSRYFLMDVRKFEMAPGRYHGCVPVSKVKA